MFRNHFPKSHVALFIALLLFFNIVTNSQTIYLNQMPANPILKAQVELRLNRLKTYLKQFSLNSSYQELYLRAKLCEIYLEELANRSRETYANFLQGQTNTINGVDNIILGSKNKVNGQRNWVFSTSYKGDGDRNLIIDDWKIQLDKIDVIRTNPNAAISKW